MIKTLVLGSAQWGWTVPKPEAFRLLDTWLGAGFREIDCATNYPINRRPADFRASEKILLEYTRAHGLRDLRITMKIGSLDNMRSPDINLSPSFILMMGEEYHRLFDGNLDCVMFHWDNRDSESDINASLEALCSLQKEAGIRPGLSGIAHPELYARANEIFQLQFDIQLKHNILQSDFERYQSLHTRSSSENAPLPQHTGRVEHRFFAYGINAGGIKLEEQYEQGSTFLARGGQVEKASPVLEKIRAIQPGLNTAFVRPPLKTMNHIGLIYAGQHPGLNGILLGVSSEIQLKQTLDFWRNLETFDYSDVYSALDKIARSYRVAGAAGNL